LENGTNIRGNFSGSAVAAMDNAIHEYAANKQKRKFNYILLVFKNKGKKRDLVLSSKEIYYDPGKDEELEPQMMKSRYQHADGSTNEEGWGLFPVARLDVKPKKRGRLQMTPQKKSKAASLFLGSGSTKKEGDSNMAG
jgi:hypothetical protein